MTQIKFLGAIWQETVKHFGHDIEERKTPDTYDLYRHNRRHEMRGANHIVRTHWWLAQGNPVFSFVTFKFLKISMEHIQMKSSLES